jgi:uncharacterized membrane protein
MVTSNDEKLVAPSLPPPDVLRQYEEIVPGSADEILKNYENLKGQTQTHNELHELMRELQQHENQLVNARITWLMTTLGLIIVAYALLAGTANTWAQIALIFTGCLVVLITTLSLVASFRSQRVIARYLREQFQKLDTSMEYRKD